MADNSKETVILLHGYFRTKKDMYSLSNYLTSHGYCVYSVTLPTTTQPLETCCSLFEEYLDDLKLDGNTVHMVGHSMGGLIIRLLLQRGTFSFQGRSVLIATPNQGWKLADIAMKLFFPISYIFKGLASISSKNIRQNTLLKNDSNKYGIIAGNKNSPITNYFLPGENDGRVELDSVKLPTMADFLILPFDHNDIHHQINTHEAVLNFLQTGLFLKN